MSFLSLWLPVVSAVAKVRARKETGKLFFDFKYQGIRCREQTALPDTRENRAKLERVAKKIEASITLNQFNYADFFPQSRMVDKFASRDQLLLSLGSPDKLPTIKAFYETWLSEMLPTWRDSYIGSVTSIFQGHVLPEFGEKYVNRINKEELLRFRAKLASEKLGNGKQRNAKTVNKILKIFRLMMKEAAERFDFKNPFNSLKLLKEQRKDIHPLSLDDVELFLNKVRTDYYNYFKVRFFSGMRSGEVTGLRWQFVDFKRRQILIRETIVRGKVEYTKNDGSYRVIDMTTPLFEALTAQKESTGEYDYVFCNSLGKPLDNRNVCNRIWYPMLDILKLKRRRLYETRHTTASLWLAAGENPEWIAKQLGHVNTEMLFKVYSRFIPNMTRRDGSAFENLLSNKHGESDE